MKNIKCIAILVLVLFLVSCAPQETAEVKVTPEKEAAAEPVSEDEPDEDEVPDTDSVKEMKVKMSDEAKELLGLAEKKVKNLKYLYFGPSPNYFEYDFWIKDDKVKITFRESKKYQKDENDYRVVYLDKSTENATGYCEVETLCQFNTAPIPVDYDKWNIKTPLDYLEEIETLEIVSTEVIDERECYRAETNIGMVWIDTYTGIPLQVEVDGERIFRAEEYVFNQVKDTDVEYQGITIN